MSVPMTASGIEPLGEVPRGAHICQFFETKSDLIETVLPYFSAGLEQGELCLWLAAEPVGVDEATAAVAVLPGAAERVQVFPGREWYAGDPIEQLARWPPLVDDALRRGFSGVRVIGCQGWQFGKEWHDFSHYERSVDEATAGLPILSLCAYPLRLISAADVLNVARVHHFAIARRASTWDVLETPDVSQLRARNRQQAAIAMLGQTAIRDRDLDMVMRDAAALAAEVLGTGRSIVWQLRPEHEDLVIRARTGWDELPPDASIPLVDGTASAYVLGHDAPVLIADLSSDERFSKSWLLREYHVATILSAAVRGRHRPWGLLSVHSLTSHPFTDDDVEFLQSLANVLALAIERDEYEKAQAEMRAKAVAALEKLHAIQSITDAALGRMALDDLCAELLARLRQALHADYAALVLIDDARTHFRIRAADGFSLDRLQSLRIPLTSPLAGLIMTTGRAQITSYLPEDAPALQPCRDVGLHFRSAMGAPLMVEGTFTGMVAVTSIEPRQFTEEELDLLRVVADRMAPVIERGRLLETIRDSGKRLEALSRRLLTVQEDERRRLAMELHDQLGQVFTALKINLDSIEKALGDEASSERLRQAIAVVDRAVGSVRDLALDLRPAMLDDLGLAAALRWYADRFARQTGIEMHLAVDSVPPLDALVAIGGFRVVQEALTNIARHADARNVWLTLHRDGDTLDLSVRDDGAGFDVPAARERAVRGQALGLMGMEERISLVSGTLEINSTPGAGTTVHARIPLVGS